MPTTPGGLPYPDGDALLSEIDLDFKALAEAIEARFPPIKGGTTTITMDVAGDATITHNLGVVPKGISLTQASHEGQGNDFQVVPGFTTTTTMRVRGRNAAGAVLGAVSRDVSWIVVG